jgi:hypothetical protein
MRWLPGSCIQLSRSAILKPDRRSGCGIRGSMAISTALLSMSPPSCRLLPVAHHSRSLANWPSTLPPSIRSPQVRSVSSLDSTADRITVPAGRLSKTITPSWLRMNEVRVFRSSSSSPVQVIDAIPYSTPQMVVSGDLEEQIAHEDAQRGG